MGKKLKSLTNLEDACHDSLGPVEVILVNKYGYFSRSDRSIRNSQEKNETMSNKAIGFIGISINRGKRESKK
ncbi:MAG: hypothetical protein Q9M36_14090 [Sulfurovum sp.]|nr:hypothetical protein [Sulfurovum sp.]